MEMNSGCFIAEYRLVGYLVQKSQRVEVEAIGKRGNSRGNMFKKKKE